MDLLPIMGEIFDNINEGIYILDRKGDYIYCNRAFLALTNAPSKEAILSLNAFRLIPEGRVTKSVAVMAYEQKKKLSIINNVSSPNGNRYRQMATATPIFDGMGEIEYMLVEMIRLDVFKRRYQQAILNEDENSVEVALTDQEEVPRTFVAESPAMKAVLAMAEQVARVDSTVLILGETGTGKEVLANFLHSHSARADKPMVEINCAALPENLLEAELFGYEKGSFTGALNTGKPGMVEEANGGTLFLDEINSLPLALQGKLLRVLESHKSKRIGSVREQEIDFRLLAATNQDLRAQVEAGTFRADLFYRINVVPIVIPPLRDRREDIVPLVLFFLDHFCKKYGRHKVFTRNVLDQMVHYDWPGNVRELQNAVESAMNVANSSILRRKDFSQMEQRMQARKRRQVGSTGDFRLRPARQAFEKELIRDALTAAGGSRVKAAELLDISRTVLYEKMEQYQLK